MIKVPYEDFIRIYSRKTKLSLLVSLALLLAFLLCVFLFSLFINYLNWGILLPLSIVISTILFFLFSLCMFGLFIPFKKELKHLKHVYYGERAKCKGVISSIGGIVSLPSFGKGLEIVLKDKVDTWVVYFDCNLEELPFKEKEEVTLITSYSFVVAYEKD